MCVFRCGVWSLMSSSTKTGLWTVDNTSWTSPVSKQGNSTGSPWQQWTEREWAHSVTLMDLSSVRLAPVCLFVYLCVSVNNCIIGSCCCSDPQTERSQTDDHIQSPSVVLGLLQDPVVIGSVCAILWCILMVAAVCLFRRHSSALLSRHGKAKGLSPETWHVLHVWGNSNHSVFFCLFRSAETGQWRPYHKTQVKSLLLS